MAGSINLFYWRDRNREVDFILRLGRALFAVEVKSARVKGTFSGLEAFSAAFNPKRVLLVGADGIPIEEFLSHPVDHWAAG
jgi:predicted AAA+ superfamily ATPase